jgi:integrase
LGDLPLSGVNNVTVIPLVDEMKKSLSARTVNKYVEYVRLVFALLRNPETGEPVHYRKWDSSVTDLPMVNHKQQRRPYLKADAVNQLVQESTGEEQALYVLLSATGMRISEALAAEAGHFTNDGRTIQVRQQVDRNRPRIVKYLKTDAASRDVDISVDTAEYLRKYIAGSVVQDPKQHSVLAPCS